MIRYLLLQNRAGKTRLAKYYVPMDDAEKHATEYDVHKVISTRDPKYTNFIEVPPPSLTPPPRPTGPGPGPARPAHPRLRSRLCPGHPWHHRAAVEALLGSAAAAANPPTCCPQFKAHKVIYRRYAGLFFVLCVDVTDNELAYLESVHLFVEILDHYFNNVCELDLVFNFHKVRQLMRSGLRAETLPRQATCASTAGSNRTPVAMYKISAGRVHTICTGGTWC